MKDSPIIILDEGTSSLDALNEQKVIDYLMTIRNKKTIIMITHKLTLNQHVDYVILLKKN